MEKGGRLLAKRFEAINVAVIIVTVVIAVIIGGKLPHLIKQWRGPFTAGDFTTHIVQQPHKLTLYGTTTCEHCASARAYLVSAGVPFNDMLIDQSATAKDQFRKLGKNAVPILVSEDRFVLGFNVKHYQEFLNC
ncbi:glutaredoxin family protein [Massilia consociata]|uniref:Glutaredoxin family protein n=1 Tax=Massilia consociata TaxID=760117 RepID=A0ABV6FCB1_9BURK